jgi:chemotaxis protein MotB
MKNVMEEDAASKVSALMEKHGLEKYTSVEITEKQIKITLTVPVLFKPGDADLTGDAMTALAGVSKVLAAVPNKVIIEGHTDNQPLAGGKYPSNWELSVARAYSVIEYFSKEKGISPERFIAAGYGEYRPVASNETLEGRAQNRRIEIVLLRKSDG